MGDKSVSIFLCILSSFEDFKCPLNLPIGDIFYNIISSTCLY